MTTGEAFAIGWRLGAYGDAPSTRRTAREFSELASISEAELDAAMEGIEDGRRLDRWRLEGAPHCATHQKVATIRHARGIWSCRECMGE